MDARFAGSQRVGDRRRRRLAVESEEGLDQAATLEELPAPAGVRRSAHTEPSEPAAEVVSLPLTGVIPSQWWKYLLGGVSGLLTGAGILVAGWYEALGTRFAGPGFKRLFSLPEGSVVAWYAGLLLHLSAQLALIIWWGRSRSQKDFDGRYRLWTRTAGVWMLFGFCAVTGAHHSFSESMQRFVPQTIWGLDQLAWLVPAALVGIGMLVALSREMSDCRASRTFLILAAATYVASAGLRLLIEIPLTDDLREMAVVGTALLGHFWLFFSMWLHARHVLHFTPDPSRAPRRRLRIPRPHFRLPSFGRGSRKSEPPAIGAAEEPQPESRERKRRTRKSNASSMPEVQPAEVEPTDASGSRRFDMAPVDEHEPITLPPRRDPERPAVAPASLPEPPPPAPQREDEAVAEEEDDAWTESFPKPDMRGMSKKQRRKLMQDLREKERAARRR